MLTPVRFKTITLMSVVLVVTVVFVATPTLAKTPYTQPNNTWINISGTVKGVAADSFQLDFGAGMITVEMDDGDRDADGYKLLPGDKVTVSGMIDDDFFETTTIEASSVYVQKLGTYFFASAVDEEDYFFDATTPVVVAETTVQGIVTDIDENEFKVDNSLRTVTIDVSSMPYNPLDDKGYQKIGTGDIVRVSGTIDDGFFTGREIVAESVIKLID